MDAVAEARSGSSDTSAARPEGPVTYRRHSAREGLRCAVTTAPGSRQRFEAGPCNLLSAVFAHPVAPRCQLRHRPVEILQVGHGVCMECGHPCALEGQRRSFGVVLVVAICVFCIPGERFEFGLQRLDAVQRRRPFRFEYVSDIRLSHRPIHRAFRSGRLACQNSIPRTGPRPPGNGATSGNTPVLSCVGWVNSVLSAWCLGPNAGDSFVGPCLQPVAHRTSYNSTPGRPGPLSAGAHEAGSRQLTPAHRLVELQWSAPLRRGSTPAPPAQGAKPGRRGGRTRRRWPGRGLSCMPRHSRPAIRRARPESAD